MSKQMPTDPRVLARLRALDEIPDWVSDEELDRATRGTFFRAHLELGIAFDDLFEAMGIKRLADWVSRHI